MRDIALLILLFAITGAVLLSFRFSPWTEGWPNGLFQLGIIFSAITAFGAAYLNLHKEQTNGETSVPSSGPIR